MSELPRESESENEVIEDIEEDQEDVQDEDPREPSVVHPPPKIELKPSDFYFGSTLGEGAFARVVHAKSKKTGTEFAIKIMEKAHIKRESKVRKDLKIIFAIINDSFSFRSKMY
jgi:hypothetical protein